MALLPPTEALARILVATPVLADVEMVPLAAAHGRTLGRDLQAQRTQPPFTASAMDGYAVRAADLTPGIPLRVIGAAAAGQPCDGVVRVGEAVRIFTGAPLPEGADTILMQEHARMVADDQIVPTQVESAGRFVRAKGLDFSIGERLLKAGSLLTPARIGLAASMGHPVLPVRRKPRVAILSTGDELVAPGDTPGQAQIISSNATTLAALIDGAGGTAMDCGIVRDDLAETSDAISRAAQRADVVVISGGASVGDHDHVQASLVAAGFSLAFWKVAIRPGKPLMFGISGERLALGLPGNPASSFVCARLFLGAMIRQLLGQPEPGADGREPAILARDLPANDMREEYMRARLARDSEGRLVADPLTNQDSSLQRGLADAEALLIRPADVPAATKGEICQIIRL